MVNLAAPVAGRMPLDRVERGFMRDHTGCIFFLTTWGQTTLAFPLLNDRTISPKADISFNRVEALQKIVDLIHPKDVGIKDIEEFLQSTRLFTMPDRK